MRCSSCPDGAFRTRRCGRSTSSVGWTPPIGGGGLRGLVYFDGRYMSKFNTGSDLDIEKTQKAFVVFNGRIGIHGPGDAWGIELWGQNLLNKNFLQVAFDAPVQGSGTTRAVQAGFIARSTQLYGAFLGEPRTFGLTLRAKMGFHRAAPPPRPRRRRRHRQRRPAPTDR